MDIIKENNQTQNGTETTNVITTDLAQPYLAAINLIREYAVSKVKLSGGGHQGICKDVVDSKTK